MDIELDRGVVLIIRGWRQFDARGVVTAYSNWRKRL